jgi:hypothetical protein
MPGSRLIEMKNSHIKHFIPPSRDEKFRLGGMNFSLLSMCKIILMNLLQQKYDVKRLNGFIPAMYFVHINTRRISCLGGMKKSRLGGII